MLSPKAKRNILRLIPFGFTWLVFSFIYFLVEKGILGEIEYYPSTGNPYDFWANLLVGAASSFIAGLLLGILEIFFLNKQFLHVSFGKKLFYKTNIYLGIIILFLLINSTIGNAIRLRTGLLAPQVWNNVWAFFSDFAFWSVVLYISTIIAFTLFYIEVSDNLGQEVLHNFFIGKYHFPIEEERIFMFLDMRSSTTIAEEIGHVKYFEMLKNYYADLSPPIIDYAGEIYQYVGDEIVVSWKLSKGLYQSNCLHCFLAMKQALQKQSEKYMSKFGLVPGFKAGFHYGKVTTGEIGTIKKDIIFTGDVLNTTARIQGLCNHYGVDILISGDLMSKISPEDKFQVKSLGENKLKGRQKEVELFTIELL